MRHLLYSTALIALFSLHADGVAKPSEFENQIDFEEKEEAQETRKAEHDAEKSLREKEREEAKKKRTAEHDAEKALREKEEKEKKKEDRKNNKPGKP